MKCLSLWQPWGSAIFAGLKFNETRGWWTPHRGPLLIHAAKRKMDEDDIELCEEFDLPTDLPLGAILGEVYMFDCARTESLDIKRGSNEWEWGNYGPGRFAWRFRDIKAFDQPIPWRGAQGVFDVDLSQPQPPLPARPKKIIEPTADQVRIFSAQQELSF